MRLSTLDWLGEENVGKYERNSLIISAMFYGTSVMSYPRILNDLWTLKSSCDWTNNIYLT